MRLDTLEQPAERRHLEGAASRDRFLVAGLQSLQEQNMAMQRDHPGNVSVAQTVQPHRIQVTYTNDMAEFAKTNQELLAEEFSQNFTRFRREEKFRFARTEDKMRAQNDELQEELPSAERVLRFFRNEARPQRFQCQAFPFRRDQA